MIVCHNGRIHCERPGASQEGRTLVNCLPAYFVLNREHPEHARDRGGVGRVVVEARGMKLCLTRFGPTT